MSNDNQYNKKLAELKSISQKLLEELGKNEGYFYSYEGNDQILTYHHKKYESHKKLLAEFQNRQDQFLLELSSEGSQELEEAFQIFQFNRSLYLQSESNNNGDLTSMLLSAFEDQALFQNFLISQKSFFLALQAVMHDKNIDHANIANNLFRGIKLTLVSKNTVLFCYNDQNEKTRKNIIATIEDLAGHYNKNIYSLHYNALVDISSGNAENGILFTQEGHKVLAEKINICSRQLSIFAPNKTLSFLLKEYGDTAHQTEILYNNLEDGFVNISTTPDVLTMDTIPINKHYVSKQIKYAQLYQSTLKEAIICESYRAQTVNNRDEMIKFRHVFDKVSNTMLLSVAHDFQNNFKPFNDSQNNSEDQEESVIEENQEKIYKAGFSTFPIESSIPVNIRKYTQKISGNSLFVDK